MELRKDWMKSTYAPSQQESFWDSKEWKHLRSRVLRKANYICQRCDKKFYSIDLSAHHIKPRAEGGADIFENLVCLCHPCHDFVEIHFLTSRASIIGSMPQMYVVTVQENRTEETDWRKWVYGGKKPPKRKQLT